MPGSLPDLKLRVATNLPASITYGVGVSVEKHNGVFNFLLDYSDIGQEAAIPPAEYQNSWQLFWNAQTNKFTLIPYTLPTAKVTGTSTTSASISTGVKNFTVERGIGWAAGMRLRGSDVADSSNFIEGVIVSYDPDTGALQIDIDKAVGSGTIASWSFGVAGEKGLGDVATDNYGSEYADDKPLFRKNIGLLDRYYSTVADAVAARPLVLPDTLFTGNYDTVGDDGGLLFSQVASEPATQPKLLMTPNIGSSVWYKGSTETLNIKQFGAKGDGSKDNKQEFLDAASLGRHVIVGEGIFYSSAKIPLTSGTWFEGRGRAVSRILAATAGQHLFEGINLNSVALTNLGLQGAGSSTVPLAGVDGESSSITGLATFSRCNDVLVDNCEVSQFYYGISQIRAERIRNLNNYIHNFYVVGALASSCRKWWIDYNTFMDCDQLGAATAYACTATGSDDLPANYQEFGSFSMNNVDGVPSWDGFMSHGAKKLRIIGNAMEDVRCGVDLSIYDNIDNAIIANNVINSTQVDTWAGVAAIHGGIRISDNGGGPATQSGRISVTGNQCSGFYSIALNAADSASVICLNQVQNALVANNIISGTTGATACAGIFLAGTSNTVGLNTNTIEGKFTLGQIRGAGITVNALSVTGNIGTQTDSSDLFFYVSGTGNIGQLAYGDNVTNSNAQFAVDGTTPYKSVGSGYSISGSASYAGSTFANGAGTTITVSVSGAAFGERCWITYDKNLQGMTLGQPQVSSSGAITAPLNNLTGGSVTLAAGTFKAGAIKGGV